MGSWLIWMRCEIILKYLKTDLFAPISHAPEYTIFREIVLAADHNAYHIAEIAILRQVMDMWPAGRRTSLANRTKRKFCCRMSRKLPDFRRVGACCVTLYTLKTASYDA